jgi:hypothetical protein
MWYAVGVPTSSLNADALTTLANLKAALNIATADTSKDTLLENCINRATGLLEEMTNRKFNEGLNGGFKARRYNAGSDTHAVTAVPDEDYVYFSGTPKSHGGDALMDDFGAGYVHLPAYPIQANGTAGVTFALAQLYSRSSGSGELWDTTSYVEFDSFIVDRPLGVLRLIAGRFAWGNRNYRVTMSAGYQGAAAPFVPPDLEAACIEIAKGIYRDNRAVTSESIGSWSRSFDRSKEDPVVTQAVSKYSRICL